MLRTAAKTFMTHRLLIFGAALFTFAMLAACATTESAAPKTCEEGYHLNDHNECVPNTP